ncbi:methyltransferase domain-containing protein [Thermogutta sp.]|uniref:methyltransferase domain-containing protein n=1 Tax=Thermogutta sp. TaxID=1962930 RepID=UPI00321F88BF
MKTSRPEWTRGNVSTENALLPKTVLLIASAIATSGILLCHPALVASESGPQITEKVRCEHPRIWLTPEEWRRFPSRREEASFPAEEYEDLRRFAYSEGFNPNLWVTPDQAIATLMVFLLDKQDPKLRPRIDRFTDYLCTAEGDSWTRPRMLKALAITYDWLYPMLSPKEKARLSRRMQDLVAAMKKQYRHSDYNNHVYLEYGPLVYGALALAHEEAWADELLVECDRMLKQHFIPTLNQLGGGKPGRIGEGGWHESMSYFSFFAYELAHQMEAWRTATGEDLFATCPGLGGAGRWLLYCTRPFDNSFAPIADIETPARWGHQETAYLWLLAQRYQDPFAQWVANHTPLRYPFHIWPKILWFDPSIREVQRESLPTGCLFPAVGWASFRSDWGPDAVWGVFVSGDSFAGHQHADQNSFVLAAGEELLVDAGQYGAKATEFHNTLLIGGGQRVLGNDPRQFVGPTVPEGPFDTGDILAFQEHPRFTMVVGDASNAYGRFEKGRRIDPRPTFIRRLLFLKPDVLVLDDYVVPPTPETTVSILFHFPQPPAIDGNTIRYAGSKSALEMLRIWPPSLPAEATTVSEEVAGQQKRRSTRVTISLPNQTAQRNLWVMAVGKADQPPHLKDRVNILSATASKIALAIRSAEGSTVRLDLPLPDWSQATIAYTDDPIISVDRPWPLAAGVLPFTLEGLALIERWDGAYHSGNRPPWDTGRPSSDLRQAIAEKWLHPGQALELGCGTGTNAIYLAQQGFDVTAIDLAPTALAIARDKAQKAGVNVRWLLGDVLNPPAYLPKFDCIYDRGCYHGVRRTAAAEYLATLRRVTKPGSRVLILAGNANEPGTGGPPRVSEEEIRGDFSQDFHILKLEPTRFDTSSSDRQGALAWTILLERKATP